MHLYGWMTARLPDWFGQHFPGEHHRKRLFNEQPEQMPGVGHFEAPLVFADNVFALKGGTAINLFKGMTTEAVELKSPSSGQP